MASLTVHEGSFEGLKLHFEDPAPFRNYGELMEYKQVWTLCLYPCPEYGEQHQILGPKVYFEALTTLTTCGASHRSFMLTCTPQEAPLF